MILVVEKLPVKPGLSDGWTQETGHRVKGQGPGKRTGEPRPDLPESRQALGLREERPVGGWPAGVTAVGGGRQGPVARNENGETERPV